MGIVIIPELTRLDALDQLDTDDLRDAYESAEDDQVKLGILKAWVDRFHSTGAIDSDRDKLLLRLIDLRKELGGNETANRIIDTLEVDLGLAYSRVDLESVIDAVEAVTERSRARVEEVDVEGRSYEYNDVLTSHVLEVKAMVQRLGVLDVRNNWIHYGTAYSLIHSILGDFGAGDVFEAREVAPEKLGRHLLSMIPNFGERYKEFAQCRALDLLDEFIALAKSIIDHVDSGGKKRVEGSGRMHVVSSQVAAPRVFTLEQYTPRLRGILERAYALRNRNIGRLTLSESDERDMTLLFQEIRDDWVQSVRLYRVKDWEKKIKDVLAAQA